MCLLRPGSCRCLCCMCKPPPVFWPWQTASMHPKIFEKFQWKLEVEAPGSKVSWHGTARHKMATAERTKSVMAHEKLPARECTARPQDFSLPVCLSAPWPKTMAELLRSFGKWKSHCQAQCFRAAHGCARPDFQLHSHPHPRPRPRPHPPSQPGIHSVWVSVPWLGSLKQSASVWRKLKWQSSKFKRLGCQFFRGSYSAAFGARKKFRRSILRAFKLWL